MEEWTYYLIFPSKLRTKVNTKGFLLFNEPQIKLIDEKDKGNLPKNEIAERESIVFRVGGPKFSKGTLLWVLDIDMSMTWFDEDLLDH